jgi:SSS family solute:Na+ symporter/sodium/pantothenate symporter
MSDLAGGMALWADGTIPASGYTLIAFGAYMVGVFLLGALAHKLLSRGTFLKEYFLGDRKLNAWVLSLTYVATSVSAGSFVGFPSWIYRNGWIMALWIAGYMVGGLVSKGVLAKRLNQTSRLSGAITVPDVLRDRFQSPALGVLASSFLLLFLLFNLVGQFKAGGLIMRRACSGVTDTAVYQAAQRSTASILKAVHIWKEPAASDAAPNKPVTPAKTMDSTAGIEKAASPPAQGSLYGSDYPDYVLGILIFAVTVIVYTTHGGFWAVTWTDVLQGLMIVAGALLLMFLALSRVGSLGNATERLREISPQLVTGPGPDDYLGPGLAVSYFCLWTLGSMGQPVGMVRLMACRDTPTLRRALFMIGLFYLLIYLPLVVTFICARALYPTEYLANSDDIMPAMALHLTSDWPILGGLILAAPYAAAMSAVAGYLLLMSSSLVRDIYQRTINPSVSARAVKRISYGTTAVVGTIVTIAALRPPTYLQFLIIFTGAGMACTFLGPIVMALYWRRATRAGALASLIGGFLTVATLWLLGCMGVGKEGLKGPAGEPFAPVYLFGLDPLIHGLIVSFVLGIVVSLCTTPLPAKHVDRYFLANDHSA